MSLDEVAYNICTGTLVEATIGWRKKGKNTIQYFVAAVKLNYVLKMLVKIVKEL